MAVTQDRWCPKCQKRVRMTRCEVCKGDGWNGRTIRVPVPELMQPARLVLPDA